jgi:hypothetical protein
MPSPSFDDLFCIPHNLEPLLGFYGKLDHMDEIDNTSNPKSMNEIGLKKINVLPQ